MQKTFTIAFFCMFDRDLDGSWYGKSVAPGVKQWHNPFKCYMQIYGYVPGDQYKWRHMKLRLNVEAMSGGYDDPHAFEDPKTGPFD